MKKLLSGIGNFFKTTGRGLVRAGKYLSDHPIKEYFVITTIIYIIIEILTRRSFLAPFIFPFTSPLVFLLNYLIIAVTTSPALIFKHKYFFYVLDLSIWLIISITDFVLRCMRTNPFSAVDLFVVKNALKLVPKYIGWGGIILSAAAILSAVVLLVILWKKCGTAKSFNLTRGLTVAGSSCLLLGAFILITSTTGLVPKKFETATDAYDKYGFSYCFLRGILQRGVISPDEYSKEAVDNLMDKLGEAPESVTAEEGPNLIYLQLESFFDVNNVINLELSDNPLPVFTELKKNFPTGKFSVNAVGGGTANTEFEVLCGMNLDDFGLMECPFSTILNNRTCPSVASVMSDVGYSTHAIHNHEATFYTRNLVYPNIGFDTFTPLEFMVNAELNSLEWAKDSVLGEEIMNALSSTEGRDFIHTVSVQPHGKYPNYEVVDEDGIKVLSSPSESIIYELEYYVNQIFEVDMFVGELLAKLAKFEEETVVVIYGDHLPTLDIDDSDLFDGNIYSTEYVIWSNYGLECEGGDVNAYELSSKVLGSINVTGGNMFRIQRELADDPLLTQYMNLMAFDLISDDGMRYSIGGEPIPPTEMSFGFIDPHVTQVLLSDKVLLVNGEDFTKASRIFINGKMHGTVYLSDTLLIATSVNVRDKDKISIGQVSDMSTLLYQSEPFIYTAPDDKDETAHPADFDLAQILSEIIYQGERDDDASDTVTDAPVVDDETETDTAAVTEEVAA